MHPKHGGTAHRWDAAALLFSAILAGCRSDAREPPQSVDPRCGDGTLAPDGSEACDDGNTRDGDGCSASCATLEPGWTCSADAPSACIAVCGDGLRRGPELCDEGAGNGARGCTLDCQVRRGWACDDGSPSHCTPICGDGVSSDRSSDFGEACDDGNTTAGDGCSSNCLVEEGFACDETRPSTCSAICGDGRVVGDETCDDGNRRDADGCSSNCVARIAFRPIPDAEPPAPRAFAVTAWTREELFIWGGQDAELRIRTDGHLYNPETRAWREVDSAGAPSARSGATSAWSGAEVLVFGGISSATPYNDGARFDPVANRWHPMARRGAPTPRAYASGVWTGSEMLVFGGFAYPRGMRTAATGGGAYAPSTDTWRSLPTREAPSPRGSHSAVWTGTELMIFGGVDAAEAALGDGARYDPVLDAWRPLPLRDAPSPRYGHSAEWTGHELIVFGGFENDIALDDGAAYAPDVDAWRPIRARPPGEGSGFAASAWTGSELLVFGSEPAHRLFARYLPSIDDWSTLPSAGAPSSRQVPASALTRDAFLIFGGFELDPMGNLVPAEGGGQFDLKTATWSPIPSGPAIEPLLFPGAARSGPELVVWGGVNDSNQTVGAGFRWDIVRGKRRPISTTGAPSPRVRHAFVAATDKLFVWGGQPAERDAGLGDGALYDALEDRWTPLPMKNAPPARTRHAAAFTGTDVIVWGGWNGRTVFGDGARFHIDTQNWTPIPSRPEVPSARFGHTAVWIGAELIIFGGFDGTRFLNTGARYDVANERWTPLPSQNAPSPRAQHTAVWTGTELIVWGGRDATGLLGTGARYDPVRDRWTPLPLEGAPSPRVEHSSTWSGAQMVVFGGLVSVNSGAVTNDGARYDPSLDAWLPLPAVHAPSGRFGHVAVWMGESLAIFGGAGVGGEAALADGVLLDL